MPHPNNPHFWGFFFVCPVMGGTWLVVNRGRLFWPKNQDLVPKVHFYISSNVGLDPSPKLQYKLFTLRCWVGGSLVGWAEFQTSLALRLESWIIHFLIMTGFLLIESKCLWKDFSDNECQTFGFAGRRPPVCQTSNCQRHDDSRLDWCRCVLHCVFTLYFHLVIVFVFAFVFVWYFCVNAGGSGARVCSAV